MKAKTKTSSENWLQSLRVALVHHWLVRMRGGEKVLEALCQIFPNAEIFTLVCNPEEITSAIQDHRIHTSWLQKLPGSKRFYRYFLPLFPSAIEQFNLSEYDLVISSDASVCKGVLTRPETCHICYCHSPMRYVWNAYHTYLNSSPYGWQHKFFPFVANYLRVWDHSATSRVDYFVANSLNVARRISKYYRREAAVIYPPIKVSNFRIAQSAKEYYLVAGELVPYKQFDLAIEAFNRLGQSLWVVGDGPEAKRLRKLAGKTIRFLGRLPDEQFRSVLSQCRALIIPGEEDFGMTVPEAHACGRPVIAFGKGGACEIIRPEVNGLCFGEATVESLCDVMSWFERQEASFRPEVIRSTAFQFDESHFLRQMSGFILEKYKAHQQDLNAGGTMTPVECDDNSALLKL